MGEVYDYNGAFELVRPLMAMTKLHSIDGLVFKFLLPLEIRDLAYTSLRFDQYSEVTVVWDDEQLREMLLLRVEKCRIGDKKTWVPALCGTELDLENELIKATSKISDKYQTGAPRVMMLLGAMLFREFVFVYRVISRWSQY